MSLGAIIVFHCYFNRINWYFLCLNMFIICIIHSTSFCNDHVSLLQSTVCERIMQQLGQADMDHAERQVIILIVANNRSFLHFSGLFWCGSQNWYNTQLTQSILINSKSYMLPNNAHEKIGCRLIGRPKRQKMRLLNIYSIHYHLCGNNFKWFSSIYQQKIRFKIICIHLQDMIWKTE